LSRSRCAHQWDGFPTAIALIQRAEREGLEPLTPALRAPSVEAKYLIFQLLGRRLLQLVREVASSAVEIPESPARENVLSYVEHANSPASQH